MTLEQNHRHRDMNSGSQAYNPVVPEWLGNIGHKFNLGIVIFTEQNDVIFRNTNFLSHMDLPKDLTSKTQKMDDWLLHLVNRGDFSEQPPEGYVDRILRSLRNPEQEEYSKLTPPNGRILKLKKFISSTKYVSVFTEDVTEQVHNQKGLEMALEMGRSGYFQYSFDTGQFDIFSSYLEKILTPAEFNIVAKEGFWPLLHTDDLDIVREAWRTTYASGQELNETMRIRTEKHGILWMRFKGRMSYNRSGKASRINGFIEDITEEYKVQDELRRANSKTEEALKSKTLFLARISHEIRTPMNAVIGIADALIHHNANPEITPKLELIQSSAGNILNTLGDTLSHSHLESDSFTLDIRLGNPINVIENACALWTEKAKANNILLNCHIDHTVPHEISFDQYRYEQCINNLLSNAIKFCEGGTIDVFSTLVEKNGEERLVLAVKDTGIGMTAEQQARIFEPFQQGDRSISRRFGGSGLGMNITKQIIEKMGGNISVKSEIGKGSIFALSFPVQPKKVDTLSPTESLFHQIMSEDEKIETPYQKLKILVADDNQTNHIVIKSLLESMVAEIYTADHGRDVLDILEVEDIDIVLMDIHMPIMDGIEATLAIRSSDQPWSDIMIIAVTADPQYQQQRLCLNIGMDYAVAKPVKLVDMLEAIDHVLEMKKNRSLLSKAG